MADESATKKLRLFVAILMPEKVGNEMTAAQQELQQLVPRDAVRWTRPEQFHLTFRFLGDIPAEHMPTLQEAVRAACADGPALQLRAQGVGFFPNTRSPRVIWAGINDRAERLAEVQKKIEDALRSFAEKPAAERFAGHVTLGRVKFLKPQEAEKLTAYAQGAKDRLFGQWTADAVQLMRSELLPTGARHMLLTSFPLRGDK